MEVSHLKPLEVFSRRHPDARRPLGAWLEAARRSQWHHLQEVRAVFPHADGVPLPGGGVATVFNIAGNKYRLVTFVFYDIQQIQIVEVLTHAEYNKDRWKLKL